ncbi:MAG: glutamine--fructose-6-phosphate transaminase (isomerizing) [Pseudomonadota bacterium]
MEYRGYDSAGIATIDSARRLARRRSVGRLVNLQDLLVHDPLSGKSGIGHTRWATHGAPTVTNAHPHQTGRVAVVHNGIIENFKELRADLEASGMEFQTETDSETIVALTEHYLAQGLSPRDAAEQTIARLEGAYALCFLFDGEDDLMIAARKGSPLVVGHGDGEVFVGSDAIALGPLTDRVTYLEEGDWAVLTRDSVEILDTHGRHANRAVTTVSLDAAKIDKAGYKHFMAKEIAEQPTVIGEAISAYTRDGTLALPDLDFSGVDRILIVACGTAYLAGSVARYWFERIARVPVEVDIASEFRYREPPIQDRTLTIVLSQSGETADTLAALRYVKDRSRIVSITNVDTSSIAREADLNLPIHAGAEIGVASTKAFSCKLAVLAVLALKAAQDRGVLDPAEVAAQMAELQRLPGLVNQALDRSDDIEEAARKIASAQDVLFLGRGQMYPLALEGALKLKEISYIHAEGYASGELKHGPIALVDETVPVIVMAPRDALFEKTISNMQEVMARDGKIVLITDAEGAKVAGDGVWISLIMPNVSDLCAPILYAIPAQLLAYHVAVAKGTDVDQPRNLAKSVTVE